MKMTDNEVNKFKQLLREAIRSGIEKAAEDAFAEKLEPMNTGGFEFKKHSRTGRGLSNIRLKFKDSIYAGAEHGDLEVIKKIFEKITSELKSAGSIPKDFVFSHIAPAGKDDLGSSSGEFPTFIYTYKEDGQEKEFKIVNSTKAGKTAGRQEFRPSKVLSSSTLSQEYSKVEDLYKDVDKFIKEKEGPPKIEYIKYLTQLAKDHSPEIDLDEIINVRISVVGIVDDIEGLSNVDKSTILTDFGEVFTGLVVGGSDYLINFPEDPATPIIDLKAKKKGDKTDIGIGVSVKKEAGAKAAFTGVIKRIKDLEKQDPGILDKFKGTELFEILGSKDQSVTTHILTATKYIADEFGGDFQKKWEHFKDFVEEHGDKTKLAETDWDNLTKLDSGRVEKVILSALENLEEKNDDDEMLDIINKFRSDIGLKDKVESYLRTRDMRWGYLHYALRVALKNELNKDKELLDSIRSFLKKLAIKQFHLYRRSDGIAIDIATYGETKFEFSPGGNSSLTPKNVKMGFKVSPK